MLVDELTAAVQFEHEAQAALTVAKSVYRGALARTGAAVRRLRDAGVPSTEVAALVARESGLSPSVPVRTRIAARLRKRTTRNPVTRCPEGLPSPPAPPTPDPLTSKGSDNIHLEAQMAAKLVKRVTETFIEAKEQDEDRDLGGVDGVDDLADVEDDDDEEQPRRARRRKS